MKVSRRRHPPTQGGVLSLPTSCSRSKRTQNFSPNTQALKALESVTIPDDIYDAWLNTLTKEQLKELEKQLNETKVDSKKTDVKEKGR